MEKQFLGALKDPRTKAQKSKDWKFDEVAMASAINWEVKNTYKFFSKRDQNGSLSCMAQSGAKLLGIEENKEHGTYVEFSALPIYQARANKPTGGMWQQDCLSILSKPTTCFESQIPSQNLHESEIDKPVVLTDEQKKVAETYRAGGYAFISNDIDKIAQVISQGKGVQLMLFFTREEWWNNTFVPKIIDPGLKQSSPDAVRHGVCAVDYALYDGKKTLVIEDSAVLPNETGQRFITEDFLTKRCFNAGYLLELDNDHSVIEKPKHQFTKALRFGMKNLEVKSLQDILKYEGFFDSKVPSTGYFGAITSKALKNWQLSHAILDFQNENDMTKIRFGAKSMLLMNQLYA